MTNAKGRNSTHRDSVPPSPRSDSADEDEVIFQKVLDSAVYARQLQRRARAALESSSESAPQGFSNFVSKLVDGSREEQEMVGKAIGLRWSTLGMIREGELLAIDVAPAPLAAFARLIGLSTEELLRLVAADAERAKRDAAPALKRLAEECGSGDWEQALRSIQKRLNAYFSSGEL